MLHILLMILKIIGIIFLVILGVLLFLILSILFVPIRYRIKGNKEQEIINGNVKVSWMFGLISFRGIYKEEQMTLGVKILGINILNLLKKRKAVSNDKNTDKVEKIEDTKEKDTSTEKTESIDMIDVTEAAQTEAKDNKVSKKSLVTKMKTFFEIPSKIKNSIQKIWLTIKNIYGKIKYWKDFITDKRTKAAIRLVKEHVIRLVKHIFPKKIKGDIVFGFEDPYTTGQVLAGISMVYPIYYKHISVSPDFSGAVLSGNIDLKGRIYVFYLLKSALTIFFNKNIQYIIHTFRNKEDS